MTGVQTGVAVGRCCLGSMWLAIVEQPCGGCWGWSGQGCVHWFFCCVEHKVNKIAVCDEHRCSGSAWGEMGVFLHGAG
jgi:hypothetical protein